MAVFRMNNKGVGGTNVTPAPVANVNTKVASSLSSIGNAITNAGIQNTNRNMTFLQEANNSIESNIYNKVVTDSVVEFNKAYQNRVNTTTNEDGSPNYLSLQSDVDNIGNSIMKNALDKVSGNHKLQSRINNALMKHTANKSLEAGNISRQRHIDFSKATLFESVDSLVEQATTDSPDNISNYISDISDIVSKSVKDGVLTSVQANGIMENARKNMSKSVYNTLISEDPESALALFESSDNDQLKITQDERLILEQRAKRGIQIVEQQAIAQKRLQSNVINSQQRVLVAQLEYEMKSTNPALVAEKVHRLYEEGQLTELNKYKLLKQTVTQKNDNTQQALGFEAIDNSIKHGIPNGNIPSKMWSKKYAQDVAMYSDENTGEPPSFQAKTNIVAKYTAPVIPFQKELEYRLLQGTPKEIAEGARAYELLMQSNPTVLKGLDDEMREKAEHLGFLLANSTLSPEQALAQVNKYQDVSDDVKIRREADFNKFDEISNEELDSTVRDQLLIDKGIFSYFTSSTDITPDFLDTYRELTKLSYIRTGDMKVALKSATNQMKSVYGVSNINGKKELMAYPPERFVPKVQLEQAFKSLEKMKGGGNFKIVSDAMTKSDPSNLSYSFVEVIDTDEGELEVPVLHEETGEILRWVPIIK